MKLGGPQRIMTVVAIALGLLAGERARGSCQELLSQLLVPDPLALIQAADSATVRHGKLKSKPTPAANALAVDFAAFDKARRAKTATVLGSGTEATVYAWKTAGGVPIAIKVFKPRPGWTELDLNNKAAYEHALLTRVYEASKELAQVPMPVALSPASCAPAYAMRLVEGETLAATLTAARNDPDRYKKSILPLADTVASAVRKVTSAAVVHKDVKPGNIIIGSDGRAYLVDFGIAHPLDHFVAEDGAGTPAYSFPGQFRPFCVHADHLDKFALAAGRRFSAPALLSRSRRR